MNYILISLVLAGLFLGRRAYIIATYFRQNNDQNSRLFIQLPRPFFIGQLITILAVGLFYFALDPVPAGFALAGAIGILLDTLLSVYIYSIRAVKVDQ
jgi:hypothetical protein